MRRGLEWIGSYPGLSTLVLVGLFLLGWAKIVFIETSSPRLEAWSGILAFFPLVALPFLSVRFRPRAVRWVGMAVTIPVALLGGCSMQSFVLGPLADTPELIDEVTTPSRETARLYLSGHWTLLSYRLRLRQELEIAPGIILKRTLWDRLGAEGGLEKGTVWFSRSH